MRLSRLGRRWINILLLLPRLQLSYFTISTDRPQRTKFLRKRHQPANHQPLLHPGPCPTLCQHAHLSAQGEDFDNVERGGYLVTPLARLCRGCDNTWCLSFRRINTGHWPFRRFSYRLQQLTWNHPRQIMLLLFRNHRLRESSAPGECWQFFFTGRHDIGVVIVGYHLIRSPFWSDPVQRADIIHACTRWLNRMVSSDRWLGTVESSVTQPLHSGVTVPIPSSFLSPLQIAFAGAGLFGLKVRLKSFFMVSAPDFHVARQDIQLWIILLFIRDVIRKPRATQVSNVVAMILPFFGIIQRYHIASLWWGRLHYAYAGQIGTALIGIKRPLSAPNTRSHPASFGSRTAVKPRYTLFQAKGSRTRML